jgi:ABC-type cobalamin/Fe3+-siderophores transport system ATPase subunit
MEKKLVTTSLSYAIHEKHLVDDVSLSFESGYLYGILGPNGSGKSSLLKIISGIWKPLSGAVTWNGDPLLNKERQALSRIISLVPQNPLPAFDFLVQDIVAMGRYPYNTRYWHTADEGLIYQALHAVDAWHLRERSVNHLSYGERQRVYIARALVTESPILLLDEPTASLDIQHQLEIWELLQKFVQKGKIVIVTTHDLALAERFCHRIAVLNQGKCIGTGTFSSLMTPFLLKEVFGVREGNTHAAPAFKQYMLS